MTTRVVVTGAGVVSPVGVGLREFESALFDGATGVRPSTRFGGEPTAEVPDFDGQRWLGNKGIRVLDRSARLLCVATQLAFADGRVPEDSPTGRTDVGMVCGSMFGSVHSIVSFDWSGLTDGPNYVNPMEFPNTVINSASGQAAIRYRLRGLNSTMSAGAASGLYALDYAAECLRRGRAQILLAGGAEELSEESLAGFHAMGAVSPSGCSQPFGAARDGAVPGEGCALWVLETEESARARSVRAWFEISGFGASQNPRGCAGCGDGAAEAMEQAISQASIFPADVACIVSSASGSPAGDAAEARALRKVFGDLAAQVPVCAPKSVWGETLGASGAFGALTAGLALQRQTVPPTAGAGSPEYGIRVSPEPQACRGEYALVNAFSCDGNNAAMVIRLCQN